MQRGETLSILRSSRFEMLIFGAFALAFFIKVPLFSLSYLASRCAHRSTDCRLGNSGWRITQNGNLRIVALQSGSIPGIGKGRGSFNYHPGNHRHYLWRAGGYGAARRKEAGCLFICQSHGFVVLGLFSFTEQGMQGALYQMLSHGISTGALFLFVGFIYERRHTRQISEFGGLATPMPWFSTLFVIASLSSIGLPFLNGFVGEFLILIGSWTSTAIRFARLRRCWPAPE